jgi:hypothetical protein
MVWTRYGDADADELLVREDVGWGSVRSKNQRKLDLIDLEEIKKKPF